jgi:DNA-binding LytR/AlgR family response regulator
MPQSPPRPRRSSPRTNRCLADELADLLHALWPQLQIVSRVGDGVAALNAVETHAPDLAFLDIHMPLLTGIEVARQLAGRCHVAFITSYDEYALEAFEAGAIDYVLKPPTAARLVTTVQRLKARLQQPPADLRRALKDFGHGVPAAPHYLQWINASRGAASVCHGGRSPVLQVRREVHDDGNARRRNADQETDQGSDRRADPTMFWQVHRSTVVNVHAIDSVIRDDRGNLKLRLKQRTETLSVSEAYAHLFHQM